MKALRNVNLAVEEGEILALVGENGAGKSTLMNILSGVYPASTIEGQIYWQGQPIFLETPKEAIEWGISIIHQELSVFPHLSVAENMVVGNWPQRMGILDQAQIKEQAQHWLGQLEADVDPDSLMSELSAGQQQLVEIAKALSHRASVLILDEPTSSLTVQETEKLFQILRSLKSQGKSLIYISHRLDEIFSLCDRICVLRDGEHVHSCRTSSIQEPQLVAHMVGRNLDRLFPERPPGKDFSDGKKGVLVRNLTSSKRKVGPVEFQIGPGEIVGLGGLLGSGRTEIAQAILGDRDLGQAGGQVFVKGLEIRVGSDYVRGSLAQGLALIPEDRKRDSLLPHRNLIENQTITRLVMSSFFKILRLRKQEEVVRADLGEFQTKYDTLEQKISDLSGGNQQKIILSRFLSGDPQFIIFDEPTRGVDVGARFEIYQTLMELAKEGKSMLVISSDLQELIGLCDRILVVSQGKIAGELSRDQFSQEQILKMALPRKSSA